MRMEKTILITGANRGIGLAAARDLAGYGAAMVMIGRDPGRSHAALAEVAKVANGPESFGFQIASLQWNARALQVASSHAHARVLPVTRGDANTWGYRQ